MTRALRPRGARAPSRAGFWRTVGVTVGAGLAATGCANALGLDAYREGAGDGGASSFVVPAGWTLIAYAVAAQPPCPPGFSAGAPVDLIGAPQPADDACTCDACTITSSPSCVTGPIALSIDTNGTLTCATAATPLANMLPGGCNTDVTHAMIVVGDDVKFTPPAPTAGACTAGQPSGHPDRVSFSERGRACSADSAASSGCAGATCSPTIAAPFAACLAHPGSVDCPSGPFGVARQMGAAAASVDCADTCTCTVTATCANATVTYYGDKVCMGPMTLPAPATGACVSQGGTGLMYMAYKYTATANPTCSADGSTATSVVLAGEQTICCAM